MFSPNLYVLLSPYTCFELPLTREKINKIIKIKNRTLAIPVAAPAIPEKPKIPAIIAIIIKVNDHRNIIFSF